MNSQLEKSLAVKLWLVVICLLIYGTVVVGGMTRLTQSGLSMVDWKPIHGVIPPISKNDWLDEFKKYQQYPEYQKINKGISLAEFKTIFFWEYFHRILGRLIGLVFFIPLVFFQFSGRLKSLSQQIHNSSTKLTWRLWFGFLLGGSQGLLGWYMVKSGLVHNPHVSHYRLAAHLGLAFFIVAYLFWIILDLKKKPTTKQLTTANPFYWGLALSIFIFMQVIYGAFTAGLKAGLNYNTFPKMAGQWIPDGLLALTPLWQNFFESVLGVQFIHRSFAWGLVFFVLIFVGYLSRFRLNSHQWRAITLLGIVLVVQFLLGMMTLLKFVPIHLAAIHQSGAFWLFVSSIYLTHKLKPVHA